MCGIVGYVGACQAAPVLLEGLGRLEYRGYDSAGIAVSGAQGGVSAVRARGRLQNLSDRTDAGRAVTGCCGVGHTRWATHGEASEINAHPQCSPGNRVALVHNGIIENHGEIAAALRKAGCVFRSQTDTEAAALLLDSAYRRFEQAGVPPKERALRAIREMMRAVRGSFAMGILFADEPGVLYAARRGSPLIVGGYSESVRGLVIASDVTALLPWTRRIQVLCDGDIVRLTQGGARIYDESGGETDRPVEQVFWDAQAAEKGGYAHFMRKEIDEQPRAVRETIAPRIRETDAGWRVDLSGAGLTRGMLASATRLWLIGCGSAYHAALAGRWVIEHLAGVPCEAEMASEIRCRGMQPQAGEWAVIISQSGETADTLAALRLCRRRGARTVAVVNVVGSAIAREADHVLYTWAGPEISVATTKAYAAQLVVLDLMAVALASARGAIDGEKEAYFAGQLLALPERIEQALESDAQMKRLAGAIHARRDAFFIGRGLDCTAAMEGSLKLKEVTCMHAEAYAAGELKHGSISLIEAGVPVIALITQSTLLEKTRLSMAEAKSRGAHLIAVSACGGLEGEADDVVQIDAGEPLFAASVAAVPLQLLAYYVGCGRGLDVDRPRNLAKSVTVE